MARLGVDRPALERYLERIGGTYPLTPDEFERRRDDLAIAGEAVRAGTVLHPSTPIPLPGQ